MSKVKKLQLKLSDSVELKEGEKAFTLGRRLIYKKKFVTVQLNEKEEKLLEKHKDIIEVKEIPSRNKNDYKKKEE